MPDELDKEQRALPFFQFRAESLVDNARLKIPGLGH
jgi:membrane-bound lytic murein transglycosylase F